MAEYNRAMISIPIRRERAAFQFLQRIVLCLITALLILDAAFPDVFYLIVPNDAREVIRLFFLVVLFSAIRATIAAGANFLWSRGLQTRSAVKLIACAIWLGIVLLAFFVEVIRVGVV